MKLFSEFLLEKQEEEDFYNIHNDNPREDFKDENEKYANSENRLIIEPHKLEEHIIHAKKFTKEDKRIARHYKTSSNDFNSPLRYGMPNRELWSPVENEHFKKLDKITSHKLKHNYITFRGFNNENVSKEILSKKPGDIIHDKGYTGTSIKRSMGFGYAAYVPHPETNQKGYHYAKIYIPKGSKGFFMDAPYNEEWGIPSENEMVLHRGTKFQVLGHTTSSFLSRDGEGYQVHHVTHLKVIGNDKKI